ncbi:polymeric immunoglobulin receptor isoform X2 [Fundulus heteroclitus]|uniref:polymeric immunoglobulin receptor isoform X2 n=1 Tax=Fundulus heteroclitus TaxID=8078 RepID=UPI00165BFAFF|nr:polymeric immunoglobulin receptor isoform X2 [Fundulus heteroclitus]
MTWYALFCFLFLSVKIKNSSPVDEMNYFYRLLGEELNIICYNLSPGPWKIFCRETCEGEDVLVNMTDKKAASGRNSAEFFERQGSFNLSVKISNLTQSDSGRYRCGLVNSDSKLVKFKAIVVEALLDGNKDHHFSKEAGSSLTVGCSFDFSGGTKSFCRGGCEEEEDVLIYTDGVRAQSGRYSIGSEKSKDSKVFYVTIKNLTQFDSGQYRCRSYLNSGKYSHVDFNISVSDASSETAVQSSLSQNTGATSGALPLILIIATLAVMVIMLSAALLVSSRRRSLKGVEITGRSDCQPMETVACEQITSGDDIYQNVQTASKNQK